MTAYYYVIVLLLDLWIWRLRRKATDLKAPRWILLFFFLISLIPIVGMGLELALIYILQRCLWEQGVRTRGMILLFKVYQYFTKEV
jgi:hypothetical protein